MLHLLPVVIAICLYSHTADGAESLTDSVHRVMKQARKDAQSMDIPVNRYQTEMDKTAQQAADVYSSSTFQKKLQCEEKRMRQEIFADYTDEPAGAEKTETFGTLAGDEKLYFFFSSSMPGETVKTYLEAIAATAEPHLIVVMRGFVPVERGTYLIRISKKNPHCVDQLQPKKMCERYQIPIAILPSLFEKFAITQVPAIVYQQGQDSWKITGDASLAYLLGMISKDAARSSLDALVKRLQGS